MSNNNTPPPFVPIVPDFLQHEDTERPDPEDVDYYDEEEEED